MNYYKMSNGEKISKDARDRKISEAKRIKLTEFFEDNGYVVCEDCQRNDCLPIDCSHNISVKEACETGRTELCWDINNITLRERECHKKKDGLDLRFKNNELNI